jgi:hypothetical protein
MDFKMFRIFRSIFPLIGEKAADKVKNRSRKIFPAPEKEFLI